LPGQERRDTAHKKKNSPHKKRTDHTIIFLKFLEKFLESTTQKKSSAHKKKNSTHKKRTQHIKSFYYKISKKPEVRSIPT
jgi:hypothetical protein